MSLSNVEAYIPDVVSRTLFSNWKRLEPFARTNWSEDGGVEEMTPAQPSP